MIAGSYLIWIWTAMQFAFVFFIVLHFVKVPPGWYMVIYYLYTVALDSPVQIKLWLIVGVLFFFFFYISVPHWSAKILNGSTNVIV